ncbi:protein RTM1 [Aspergillus lentulus]|uniref:Protein RTM1 n=1 Tax=Aspergillus lentulus TaxID=293939 RepID=A0AAN4PIS2_ASPLE|nr:protein RTM1 [Aspergillus lentulus]
MATEASSFKLYRYDPSIGAAVVFVLLFVVGSCIHTYQVARTRTWFFVPFVLGGYFEWIGYIGRAISGTQSPNWTVQPYIQQTLLLLIAPTLFAASIYMELGRIVLLTNGDIHCWIRQQWLTKIFLLGDIISFIMQGAGGGIMASGSASALSTGEHIIIGGLVVQLIFFSLFLGTTIKFHIGIQNGPTRKVVHSQPPWERHIYAMYSGSLLIFVRSIFRLIEYGQGNDGYLVTHEAYMYIFDGVLMLLNMGVFAWIHPSLAAGVQSPRELCNSQFPSISHGDTFGSFLERVAEAAYIAQEWSSQDPELMHHFTLHTSKSLARRQQMQDTWQIAFPTLAYSNEFLMHGILALSALHLAHLKPENHSRYITSSRFHISLGLRSFRRILTSPTTDNCCALFAFSSLIMVYVYASPAESAEVDMVDTLESTLHLFKLCRGTLVLRPYINHVRNSSLGPLFRQEFGMQEFDGE